MKKILALICVIAMNTLVHGQTQMSWFSDLTICETLDTTVTFPPGDFSEYTFIWKLDGDSLSTDSNVSILASGLYSLYLYGSDTLFDEFNAVLESNNPDFALTLTDSDIHIDSLRNICIEKNLTFITSQEGHSHFWYLDGLAIGADSMNESTLSIEAIADEIIFNQEHEFYVKVENTCGIHQSKNRINMIINECHCALDMPNVFSPNDDSENDLFKPLNNHELETDAENICESTDFTMEVFNQWGKHITTVNSKDEYPSWDGLNKRGKNVPAGIYFYNILYRVNIFTLPKEKSITGFFHLYR